MRNRFTIDTDIVFDSEPDLASPPDSATERLQRESSDPQQKSDTDRWVEEQFDLEEYEDREEVKETDILSDEDEEFCRRSRVTSSDTPIEGPISALSLESEETESEDLMSPVEDLKQSTEDENQTEVWVRREQLSPDCDT